jgi:hypothetical protein
MKSLLQTVDVLISTADPSTVGPIYAAPSDTVVRVFVSNVGAAPIILGFQPNAVVGVGLTTGGNFRLPANREITIIMQPQQTLYAAGVGAGGRLSIAVSAALPLGAML